MSDEPVSEWLRALKKGDNKAASQLWTFYYSQLKRIALSKLKGASMRVADEEDVAAIAMATFFERANTFPDLENRQDLWNLLVTITERKAYNQIRHQTRIKRGGGKTRGDSVFLNTGSGENSPGADQFASDTQTPEFQAIVTENFQELLDLLDEDEAKIALLRFDGFVNQEIAAELGVSQRTVVRAVKSIRDKWSVAISNEETEPDDA